MLKRIWALGLLCLMLSLSGCALRTVEEMYSVPKRSQQYNELQSAIDIAMAGLDYAAPLSGDNRQTLQTADLDGDGRMEYLVFAKGRSDKPLQMLIFQQDGEGKCQIQEVIAFRGTSFEQVEYVEIDDQPGCEIVLGRQLNDQVVGTLSVFSFSEGNARQLLSTSYSKFVSCDLSGNGREELLVMRPGEADMAGGVAVLYSYKGGAMERSVEAKMSAQPEDVKRIAVSKLHGGFPAVYVASTGRQDAVVTDVFTLRDGRFVNVAANGSGISVSALRNYAVYPDDLDADGIFELPRLISMKPISTKGGTEKQYLLRWYSMDPRGNEVDKLCTFHNFAGGWYLMLDSSWATYLTMEQWGNSYTFYMWSEDYDRVTILFTITEHAGNDREYQATQNNRFVLHRAEGITYAGKLEAGSALYGFTEEFLVNSFRLIPQD